MNNVLNDDWINSPVNLVKAGTFRVKGKDCPVYIDINSRIKLNPILGLADSASYVANAFIPDDPLNIYKALFFELSDDNLGVHGQREFIIFSFHDLFDLSLLDSRRREFIGWDYDLHMAFLDKLRKGDDE